MKLTKKQKEQLVPFARKVADIEGEFWTRLSKLEREMEKATGIEGIEFFVCDNGVVGIGNATRTMELIFLEDLEEK